ncbi:MAG: cytochrome c [Phenylobacterium sp.]
MRVLYPILLLALAAGSAAAAPSGAELYADNCAACHMPTGLGVKGAFPALAGDKLVTGPHGPLIATVLNGRGGMPAYRDELSDADLAKVISYLRTAWGNKAAAVTAEQVADVRAAKSTAPKPKNLQAH